MAKGLRARGRSSITLEAPFRTFATVLFLMLTPVPLTILAPVAIDNGRDLLPTPATCTPFEETWALDGTTSAATSPATLEAMPPETTEATCPSETTAFRSSGHTWIHKKNT
jgi:hypothetical protein